jgi:hypothetical protein
VPELEDVAVLEGDALVAGAAQDDAVLRAGVLHAPAVAGAHQARVRLRHADVRHPDDEPAAGGVALPAARIGPSEDHLVEIGERVACRRGQRAVALEQRDEHRRGGGPRGRLGVLVVTRHGGEGDVARLAHTAHTV